MPKAKCKFTQTDIRRGIKAIESAGLKVGRVEIQEGKIILFPQDGKIEGDQITVNNSGNPWDEVLNYDHRH